MPYHKPIPDDGKSRSTSGGKVSGMQSFVQVEKIGQIAFILPSAVVIGWLGGAWLDGHFHQKWMTIAGLIFGAIAGLTSAVRMALATSSPSPARKGTSKPSSQDKKNPQ